jgi:hypothetical protein
MARMLVEPVDRRTSRWEIDRPSYRIYFWDQIGEGAWRSEEWRITDTDVQAVLAWASDHARGRYITSWVEIVVNQEIGLARLNGWEPTRTDVAPTWVSTTSTGA